MVLKKMNDKLTTIPLLAISGASPVNLKIPLATKNRDTTIENVQAKCF